MVKIISDFPQWATKVKFFTLWYFKILVGSHKVGRIDHVKIGDQVGADLERLAQVEKFCPLLHVEVRCSSTTFNQNSEYFTLHVYHKRFFSVWARRLSVLPLQHSTQKWPESQWQQALGFPRILQSSRQQSSLQTSSPILHTFKQGDCNHSISFLKFIGFVLVVLYKKLY